MRSLALAVTCLTSAALAAGADTKEVTATGQAAVVAGNTLGAKDKATEDALRNAVQQACGVFVDSSTLVEKSQLVDDKILTHAKGYVSKFDVVASDVSKGVATVTVKAVVGTNQLEADLASIGLTLQRKGMPRLAVLVVEQRVDQDKPVAWWQGQGGGKVDLKEGKILDQKIVENTLLSEWLKAGFTFVDPEAIRSGAAVAGAQQEPTASFERKLGESLKDCDVVVMGQAFAKKSDDLKNVLEGVSQDAKSSTRVSCTATVSLRALNADSGMELLAAAEETAMANHLDVLGCGRDALVKAASAASARLQKDLLAKWNGQLANGNKVRVVVKGIDSVKSFSALKTAFANQLRGAKVTNSPRLKDGVADFDLVLTSSVEDAAGQMETWKLGAQKLKVKSMTNNAVEAEVSK
jgi:hypothetical protein